MGHAINSYFYGKLPVMKNMFTINALLIFCFSFTLTGSAFAQAGKGQIDLSRIPVPHWHYLPEYTFDNPSDSLRWANQSPGLHVSFVSTDELYLRCEAPSLLQETREWEDAGWKGERLNAQVLVWSPDSVEQIQFRINDLATVDGNVIGRNQIKLHLVRYVLSNYPYGASNFTCDVSMDSAWLLPDRFETFERFDLPGRTVRPVWISIEIPRTAIPGIYSGTIEIYSIKGQALLSVSISVQDQTLPEPHDWNFRLDLWQNPRVVADFYHLKPWSPDHMYQLKKHLELYANAGGTFITTYAVHSPWSDNSYTLEGEMIESIRTVLDDWTFDYSIFDTYVGLAMETGIDRAITVYTPLPWADRFRYLDEQTGNYAKRTWRPGSPEYTDYWDHFLTDLRVHLIRKGWFDKTYLGINENTLDYTLAAIKVIKENSTDWKITYAGDWHPELSDLVDDYSAVITREPGLDDIRKRHSNGRTTTFYVCCNPTKPNNFVFSPPVEGRFIGWHAAACGHDGFLRWAYDAWPADPERDARHALWPAGDCFLIYPGGNSSLRFEKLREGIVDYEKIRILREKSSRLLSTDAAKKMQALEDLLAGLIRENNYSKRDYSTSALTGLVNQGKVLLRQLSDAVVSEESHSDSLPKVTCAESQQTILTHLLVPAGPIPTVFDPDGVYPYVSYSETSNRPVLVEYRIIILENDHLKATICPDLGGKVMSIVLKPSGKEVLYVPEVIRPTRILPRFYFVAGGIEVSFPISHSPTQNDKVLYRIDKTPERTYVTCGERELRFGMHWSVEYSLGPDDDFLTERVVFQNPGTMACPWMSWSNAALPSDDHTEFHFPAGMVLSHSSVIDTIAWKSQGPAREADIHEMTGYFWKTADANAFGVFNPSTVTGLYHVADASLVPGMKLWSYGRGTDSSWATLSTARRTPYVEIQGGPIGDQSIKHELAPGKTHFHTEFWIPSGEPMDLYSMKVPVPVLRPVDEVPFFGWARAGQVNVWMDLRKAYINNDSPPSPPAISDNCWAPSGMEDLGPAFEWVIRQAGDSDAQLWSFYHGTWLAGRGDTLGAIRILKDCEYGVGKALLARLLMLKGDARGAVDTYRSIEEPWLLIHPQVIIGRDKALRRLGPETLSERASWLDRVAALQDEWIIERSVQWLIDSGDASAAKDLLLSTHFQKVHQTYTRTGLWYQICKMLDENPLPIPAQLGEDRLARFGAYREFE